MDAFFGPIMRWAAAAIGQLVHLHGDAILGISQTPAGRTFIVLFCLLYSRGQGAYGLLCTPAWGRLRTQALRECHAGQLGGHFGEFGRAKTG